MTRDELKEIRSYHLKGISQNVWGDFVDKIYDDFKIELEAEFLRGLESALDGSCAEYEVFKKDNSNELLFIIRER